MVLTDTCTALWSPLAHSRYTHGPFARRKARNGQFVPNTGMARRVALDIARGLHYLHSRSPAKIVHFDLKVCF